MSIATEPEAQQAPLDSLYEILDGRRVEKPPLGVDAVGIATTRDQLLGGFARANRLGWVVAEMLLRLQEARPYRRPDVAFVSYERWPRDRKLTRVDAWAVVPDLAIEVISPTNTAGAMQRKVREYFEAGVRRVWIVYPDERLVHIYDSVRRVRIFGAGDVLDGEDILPGFHMAVDELFEKIASPDE
jgi:Uma2 family endonuclease